MFSFGYYDVDYISIEDFIILSAPFKKQIHKILPVPASVHFQITNIDEHVLLSNKTATEVEALELHNEEILAKPKVSGGTLTLTIHFSKGDVYILFDQIDPALLAKMSSSWLNDFQTELIESLKTIRTIYIEPDTGLYNKRALSILAQNKSPFASLAFFQVGTLSRSASINVERYQQMTGLLKAVSNGFLFSCGFNAFGMLIEAISHKEARQRIVLFQKALKRVGIKKVQIGLASCSEGVDFVSQAWRSMLIAEKRGPFGVCDNNQLAVQPFSFCSDAVLKQLRKKWRGVGLFGLVALSVEDSSHSDTVIDGIVSLYEGNVYAGYNKKVIFLYFDGADAEVLTESVAFLKKHLPPDTMSQIEAIGCSVWPTLNYSKTEMVSNSLKALMHCRFYEKGAMALFDYLSLNISGDYYFEQGDYYAAVKDYRNGLKLQPGNVDLLNSLGVTLVEFNQFAKAVDCFLSVLQIQPKHVMALANLGLCQTAMKEKKLAIENLELALEYSSKAESEGPELYMPLARLYTENGESEKAIKVLMRWQALPRSSGELLLFRLLGENYFITKEYKKAAINCQKALQIHPRDSISMSILGLTYIIQNQGDDVGVSLCMKAVELDETNSDNNFRLAKAYFEKNEIEKALSIVTICLRIEPKHINGIILLAQIEFVRLEKKKALSCLRRVQHLKTLSSAQQKEVDVMLAVV